MQQYHDHLMAILSRGTYKAAARKGMPGSTSLFGYQSRYSLQDGFPIVTTKKIFWKGIVAELLWFLRGDTNIKFLDENQSKFWHEDAYNFYCLSFDSRLQPRGDEVKLSFDEFCKTLRESQRKDLPSFETRKGKYVLGDCGYQYGRVWRSWNGENNLVDQVANVVQSLKANPLGRRHIVTAIDPAHDQDLALYWCHAMFQFNCRPISNQNRIRLYLQANEGKEISNENLTPADLDSKGVPKYFLDCMLTQRSSDTMLGVPFNSSSYSLLTFILGKILNMVPGEFIHSHGDSHIYDNHLDAVKEQLERDPNKYKLPALLLTGDWDYVAQTLDFSRLTVDNFQLIGYESYPKLTSDTTLSTGMAK